MQVTRMDKKIDAEHGVVSSSPDDFFGYFGWPTLARMEDGRLVAAASGFRTAHVCPFGRNVVCFSDDDGASWTSPMVANDSPLDDRDTGVVPLGGDGLLISWFTTDNRGHESSAPKADLSRWREGFSRITDENAVVNLGAWCCTSLDRGETWGPRTKVPLTAPHGPIRLGSGDLLYFGKQFLTDMGGFKGGKGSIGVVASSDAGRSWDVRGEVPLVPGTVEGNYHEPHVAELPDGKLVGLIRVEECDGSKPLEESDVVHFSLVQTTSVDGGRTWTPGEPLNFHGCPPHLLVHSSGALICSYGRRLEPYGERVMISRDGADSWIYDYCLRDDGPDTDTDLGYPSTVELGDGSLLTMYYQKPNRVEDKCSLLWSRWQLPN